MSHLKCLRDNLSLRLSIFFRTFLFDQGNVWEECRRRMFYHQESNLSMSVRPSVRSSFRYKDKHSSHLKLFVSLSLSFRSYLLPALSITKVSCVSGIWKCLAWLRWFAFKLKPVSGNDCAAQKWMVAHFKSSQEWYKNNYLTTFTNVQSLYLIHYV